MSEFQTRQQVAEKAIDVLLDHTSNNIKRDAITEDSGLSDQAGKEHSLGLDSLEQVELVLQLETEFGISISDDEQNDIKTVRDVIDKICEKKGIAVPAEA